jgi:ABC-type Zn uptake system ZnuABC Zn-binding protein ZnuA
MPLLRLLVAAASLLASAAAQRAVVATTPDLASLCRLVGGDAIAVTALCSGPEDPHFAAARPGMLAALRSAAALVEVGRELEVGWLPLLVGNARNGRVLPGAPGRIDASVAVRALGVPAPTASRADGDLHAGGNPHYLLDPLCGLEVAGLLRDRFSALWPAERERFAAGCAALRRRLAEAMVGSEVAARYDHDAAALARAFAAGTLLDVLDAHGDRAQLGGWFRALAERRGARVVVDHELWPYFAERFGLEVVATLEPKPGIAPGTAHLQRVVEQARARGASAILCASYFPRQHAERVATALGIPVVVLAHQTGAMPGTDDYVAFVDHNVRTLAAALPAMAPAK